MSGLTNFLTPYSHLIFANRDKVIVGLALVLGWTVIQLLLARWRTERLERDLVTARASASTSPARSRHLSAPVVEEAPAESGGLPPVKGGRSYARNLGSALQKAGIPPTGPQLYSPPVPTGWNPNTGTGQPSPMQPPMQPPTYAPPPGQWAAPPSQPAPPWAYPAGANRPPFAPQPMGPIPAPYAPAPANQGQPLPAGYPAPGPVPFPQPFPSGNNGPETGRQGMEAAEPPADDSGAKENGRRGKPKRRRFNLSLGNLEKIVQAKPTEPAPSTPAIVPVAEAPAAVAAPAPSPATDAPLETPTLFDHIATEAEAEPAPVAEEPAASEQQAEPTPEPERTVLEPQPSSRPDMRSMLFGEEPEPSRPAEVTEAPETTAVPEPAEATSSWQAAEPVVEDAPATSETVSAEAEAEHRERQAEVYVEPQADVVVAEAEQPAPVEVVEAVSADPPAESDRQEGKAGVLVIIEDDKAAADYYATLFRGNGYQVDVANDGVSGVDLCVRVQPQVILLDVMMPRQNGILVLQTLRASDETRNTPVVVMSNFSEPTLIKRALQLGALEYVIKTQVEGAALLTAMPHWMNREKAFAA